MAENETRAQKRISPMGQLRLLDIMSPCKMGAESMMMMMMMMMMIDFLQSLKLILYKKYFSQNLNLLSVIKKWVQLKNRRV